MTQHSESLEIMMRIGSVEIREMVVKVERG